MARNGVNYCETLKTVNECVVSEYFTNNLVMDEGSMTKNKEKHSTSSDSQARSGKVQKKHRRRVKGQKDIRALLKSKKNELISYCKDFDTICKQSGIDIDPEQLQLAIALSKSLQDSDQSNVDAIENEKTLTSNQRKGKIRTTLQEYGFKVPENKKVTSKKVKRYRKQYKLLLASDTEKQQLIADKYAQILLTNVSIRKISEEKIFTFDNSSSYLYNLSTNVPYECLKDDEIFYVNNLVQKSLTDRHHMLRDWSTIPGRPASPKLELSNVCFNNIECTQDELSNILSGTIAEAQDIVKCKYKLIDAKKSNTCENSVLYNLDSHKSFLELPNCQNSLSIDKKEIQHKIKMNRDLNGSPIDVTSYEETHNMISQKNRSCSPDIFDDEVTIIIDSPENKVNILKEIPEKTMVREQNDYMDLTECVGVLNYNNTNFKHISYLSQGNNKTEVNQNDVMELTECVPALSQKKPNGKQSDNDNKKENDSFNIIEQFTQAKTVDLTQCPHSSNKSPIAHNGECDLEDTIIMMDEEFGHINTVYQSNLLKIPTSESDIIDLVKGTEVYNYTYKNGSVNNLQSSIHTTTKLDSENDPQLYDLNNKSPKDPISRTFLEKGKCIDEIINADLLRDNKDAVDLTQSSNSEDSAPLLQMPDCYKNSSVGQVISSAYETEKEYTVNFSKDSNQKYDSPTLVTDYESAIEAVTNCSSNNSRRDEAENVVHCKKSHKNLKEMDGLQIIHDKCIDDNSFNLTVAFNDENCYLNNINSLNLQRDGINFVDLEHNDHELNNKLENVSNGSQSSIKNSKISDADELLNDKTLNIEHTYIFENDPDQIPHFEEDFNQQCDNFKQKDHTETLSPQIELGKDEQEDYDTYNYINNEMASANTIKGTVTTKGLKNTDKCGNSSHDSSEISLTQCLNTIRMQNEIYDINNEHQIIENVTNRKESITKPLEWCLTDQNCSNNMISANTYNQNCEIDLTQHSDCSEERISNPDIKVVDNENDISVDYDEMYIETNSKSNNCITVKPSTSNNTFVRNDINCSGKEVVSSSSQISEVFEISDNEFNYSINQYKNDNDSIRLDRTRFDIGGISTIDEFLSRNSVSSTSKLRCSCGSDNELNYADNKDKNCLPESTFNSNDNLNQNKRSKSCTEVECVNTPSKSSSENVLYAQTPKHDDYVIKTDQVTPMPCYEMMTSPERDQELDKYGIKPLKRKRAIQILTHIYNQTHPVMEIISEHEDCSSPSKIRKINDHTTFPRKTISTQINTILANECVQVTESRFEKLEPEALSQKSTNSRKEPSKNSKKSPKKSSKYFNDSDKENNLYEETKQLPDIKNIECCSEDWVFQTREKAKVHSCRVPLHIAFHNYVSCRRALREAILKYEPINIDDIHKGLVAIGYRYNPKDLLKFMDRKCITVKTADNTRNTNKK